MLHLLQQREQGLDSGLSLLWAESTRRAYALEVSKHVEFQKIHTAAITSLDVDASEDRYLLSGASDGLLCVHDLENASGQLSTTLTSVAVVGRSHQHRHKHSVESVQWYPLDNGMFLTSGADKLLKIWDANALKPADEFQFSGIVYSHQMSATQQHCLVAVATQSPRIKLIDLKSGSATHTLKGHSKSVLSLRWSPRSDFLLASGSADSRVLLWDVRMAKGSLAILDQFNGDAAASPASVSTAHDGWVNGVCFLPDGLHLLTLGSDNHLRLWDVSLACNTNVNYGRVDNTCRRGLELSASSTCCRPDLIFVPADSDIVVYETFTGTKVDTLRGHFNQVHTCIFRSATQELVSGGGDRNILLWQPVTDAIRAYEAHLKAAEETRKAPRSFASWVAATADAWSSDED